VAAGYNPFSVKTDCAWTRIVGKTLEKTNEPTSPIPPEIQITADRPICGANDPERKLPIGIEPRNDIE
jgi:hypothetical protein